MENLIALGIVVFILGWSIAVSLGVGKRLKRAYETVVRYVRKISVGTTITIALMVGAIALAMIASM